MKTSNATLVLAVLLAVGALGVTGCHSDSQETESAVTTVYTQGPAPAPPAPGTVTVVPPPPSTAVPAAPPAPAPTTPLPAPAPAPMAEAAMPAPPAPDAAAATNDVVTAAVPAQRPPLPTVVNEILDLSQADVGDNVLIEYANKAQVAYELSADDILYLKDVGLTDDVVAAIVKRGHDLRDQGAPQARVLASTAPAPPVAEPQAAEPTPAPQTVTQVPPSPQPATVTQPVTQDYDYWYSTLAPYGSWVYLSNYGWCWQPTVARTVADWRPYGPNGRWMWTSSGWYWDSYYSWGWAPFHYGRWYLGPSCGWVWVPGSVWAPAWVTWRYCDNYWGWAALPPSACWSAGVGLTWYGSGVSVGFGFNLGWSCYTYVPPAYFCHPHPYRYCAPRHEVANIHNTTVVNNITYNNSTIVNNGIAPQRYKELTRQEVPRATLAEATAPTRTAPTRAGVRPEQNTKLAVYRPTIPDQPGFVRAKVDNVPAQPTRRSQELSRSNPALAPGAAVPMKSAPERRSANNSNALQPDRTPTGRDAVAVPSRGITANSAAPSRVGTTTPNRGEVGRSTSGVLTPERSATAPASRAGNPPASVGRTTTPPSRSSAAPGASRDSDPTPATPSRRSPPGTSMQPAVPTAPGATTAPSRGVQSVPTSRSQPGTVTPAPTAPQRSSAGNSGVPPANRSSFYQAPVTTPSRGEIQRAAPAIPPGGTAPKFSNPSSPGYSPPSRSTVPGSVPGPAMATPSRSFSPSPVGPPSSAPRSVAPPSFNPSPAPVPSAPSRSSGGAPAGPPPGGGRGSVVPQPK